LRFRVGTDPPQSLGGWYVIGKDSHFSAERYQGLYVAPLLAVTANNRFPAQAGIHLLLSELGTIG
jgi:hypothetical protein